MEVNFGKKHKGLVLIYEAMGTGILIFSVNMTNGNVLQPLLICFGLMASINILGPVSGGHFNPAVTMSILMGYLGTPEFVQNAIFAVMIAAAQTGGAFLGCFMVYLCTVKDTTAMTIRPPPVSLCPQSMTPITINQDYDICDGSNQYWNMFLVEVIGTFIFTSSVLSIVYAKIDNKLAGILIIVFTLCCCIGCAGPISGGCINPAVGIAQTIFQAMVVAKFPNSYKTTSQLQLVNPYSGISNLWVYMFAPTLGGVLAGLWKQFDRDTKSKF